MRVPVLIALLLLAAFASHAQVTEGAACPAGQWSTYKSVNYTCRGGVWTKDLVTVGISPTAVCGNTTSGTLRYSATSSTVEYCQGTAWISMGPSATDVPAFSVHKNGTNQTVTSGANALLTWSTEDFDTNGNFASNRFTPTVRGKYLVTASVLCSTANSVCFAFIYKNGGAIATSRNYSVGSGGYYSQAVVTALVDMNGLTDYLEAYGNNSTGTVIDGTSAATYFQGNLISSGNGSADNFVPTGAVMAFDLASCPSGWTEYTAARGRFLRGIDNGAGLDPDGTRAPGAAQADMVGPHTHGIGYSFNAAAGTGGASPNSGNPNIYATVSNGTAETRPKNVAVLFCRKT